MAVTIVVLSGGEPGAADLSLTLDAPRLVIGRGEGCDVRLPDASVSHRHASIRQRGGEHVLLDENSRNGTFMDRVRLPPQTPRGIRNGERVRVGRVWLELRVEPAIVKGSTAAAAKELALNLVARGMRAQGEEPGPRLTVLCGPDAGATLILGESVRSYAIGRAPDADLVLVEEASGRKHARVSRRGDLLLVQDAGTPSGTHMDGELLGPGEVTWRVGQVLQIGGTEIGFDYAASEALAEIENSPDEQMPDGEGPEPPETPADPTPEPPLVGPDGTPTPPPAGALTRPRPRAVAADTGAWGKLDSAVILLALGVLALSIVGAFFLLGR